MAQTFTVPKQAYGGLIALIAIGADKLPRLREEAGRLGEDDAIEAVYDRFQHLLGEDGGLAVIDEMLRELDVSQHHISVLLSILTITALSGVRKHLSSRPLFYDRVKEYLTHKEGPQGAEELLVGLS